MNKISRSMMAFTMLLNALCQIPSIWAWESPLRLDSGTPKAVERNRMVVVGMRQEDVEEVDGEAMGGSVLTTVAAVAQTLAIRHADAAHRVASTVDDLRQDAVLLGLSIAPHAARHIAGYLTTACRREIHRQLRRERRHWRSREEQIPDLPLPGDVFTKVALRRVIFDLSQEARDLLEWRLEGYSIAECSERACLTLSTTKNRLSRIYHLLTEASA